MTPTDFIISTLVGIALGVGTIGLTIWVCWLSIKRGGHR
jgi:hypothetical protein